jgi:hypothetical protein
MPGTAKDMRRLCVKDVVDGNAKSKTDEFLGVAPAVVEGASP